MSMGRGEKTKANLILIGLQVWRDKGLERVTATHVGSLCGVTHAACLYHFQTTENLRRAIADYAVRIKDPVLVPQLITAAHPAVAEMSDDDKRSILTAVLVEGGK